MTKLLTTNDFSTIMRAMRDIGAYQCAKQADAIHSVTLKGDDSPVTDIDLACDDKMRHALRGLSQPYAIVSEEAPKAQNLEAMESAGPLWVLCPLDGTRSYIKNRDEFAINLGLLSAADATGNRTPVFGAVYFPKLNKMYFTDLKGQSHAGALAEGNAKLFKSPPRRIRFNETLRRQVPHIAVGYKDEGTTPFGEHITTEGHTGGYRTCLAAEGVVDGATFNRPCSIWDTAGIDAVARGAGARLFKVDAERRTIIANDLYYGNDPSRYWPDNPLVNPPFLAASPAMLRALDVPCDVALPHTGLQR